MRILSLCTTALLLVACASSQSAPSPSSSAPATSVIEQRRVAIGESFSPKTDAASIAAFALEIAPVDTGGECFVMKTGGNGATVVTAGFPQRIAALTTMSMTFDSAGHVVRFSDHRSDRLPIRMVGATPAQSDSVRRVQTATTRSSTVSLDFAIDQAVATNMGGGRSTTAILSNVRALEKLTALGPPVERMARLRRLCGV